MNDLHELNKLTSKLQMTDIETEMMLEYSRIRIPLAEFAAQKFNIAPDQGLSHLAEAFFLEHARTIFTKISAMTESDNPRIITDLIDSLARKQIEKIGFKHTNLNQIVAAHAGAICFLLSCVDMQQ